MEYIRIIFIVLILSGVVVCSILFKHYFTIKGIDDGKFISVSSVIESEKIVPIITEDDIILGNPAADLIIIEYGDLQCPFCKDLHPILQRIIFESEYGLSGRVAWVFRHYPHIDDVSYKKAESVWCVSDQTDRNIVISNYITRVLEESNEVAFDSGRIGAIVRELNIDVDIFNQCLEEETYTQKVIDDALFAEKLGARETPFLIFLTKAEGVVYKTSEVRTYELLQNIIDSIFFFQYQ